MMILFSGMFQRIGGRTGDSAGAGREPSQRVQESFKQIANGKRSDQGQIGPVPTGIPISGKNISTMLLNSMTQFLFHLQIQVQSSLKFRMIKICLKFINWPLAVN